MLKVKFIEKVILLGFLFLFLPLLKLAAQDSNNYVKSLSATHQRDRGVKLSWNTKYNDTTAYFIVERSLDGQNFEELGKVESVNTQTTFKFVDYKPYVETSYYRIKVMDYDGNATTSTLTSVYIAGTGKPELVLYPMPVGNANSLNLDFRGIQQEFKAMVILTDQFGRQVLSKEVEINNMDTQDHLDLEGKLTAGNYYLTVLGHSGQSFKIGKLLQIVD